MKLFSSFQIKAAVISPKIKLRNSKQTKHSFMENLFSFRFYENSLNKFITINANHDKFLMKIRAKLAYLFHYNDYWLSFLHFLILINIIVLSYDKYPIKISTKEILEFIDFLIFLIYFFEICLKVIAFGPSLYFKSGFNIIDFLIVASNTMEYIIEIVQMFDNIALENTFAHFLTINTVMGNFIKTTKVMRILRTMFYSNNFRAFALLLNGLVGSLFSMKYFSAILISFVLLTSLIGNEIFAYKVRFSQKDGPQLAIDPLKGFQPTINYDTIGDSLIGVVAALYNEEWHVAAFQYIIGVGYKTLFFYYPLIILGQMTCILLFLAIFLNSFIKYVKKKMMKVENLTNFSISNVKLILTAYVDKIKKIIEKKKPPMKIQNQPAENRSSLLFGNTFKSSHYLKQRRDSHFQRLSLLNNIPNMPLTLLGIASPTHSKVSGGDEKIPIEKKKKKTSSLIDHEEIPFFYSNSVSQLIGEILSNHYFETFMLVLAITSMVVLGLDSPVKNPEDLEILFFLDYGFVAIYSLEFFLKIMIFGSFKGKRSYFQESFYNFLDFLNVVISIAALFEDHKISRKFHICKILRCFRIIKFARNVNKNMQILSTALLQAFPNIMKILFFLLIFIFIFSIFAMKYLKGLMYKCLNIPLSAQEAQSLLVTKNDCFDYGGDWVNDDLNYDNVVSSFFSLFQIVTGEGWSVLMYFFF